MDATNKAAALSVAEADVSPIATELDSGDLITMQTVCLITIFDLYIYLVLWLGN